MCSTSPGGRVSQLGIPMMMGNAAPPTGAAPRLEGPRSAPVFACAAGRRRDRHRDAHDPRGRRRGRGQRRRRGRHHAAGVRLLRRDGRASNRASRARSTPPRRLVMGEGRRRACCSKRPRWPRERGGHSAGRCSDGGRRRRIPLDGSRPGGGGAAAHSHVCTRGDGGVAASDLALSETRTHGHPSTTARRTEALRPPSARGRGQAGLPVSSTKSPFGHLLGAAGAVEAVATLLAAARAHAPPRWVTEGARRGLDLDYVPTRGCHDRRGRQREGDRALQLDRIRWHKRSALHIDDSHYREQPKSSPRPPRSGSRRSIRLEGLATGSLRRSALRDVRAEWERRRGPGRSGGAAPACRRQGRFYVYAPGREATRGAPLGAAPPDRFVRVASACPRSSRPGVRLASSPRRAHAGGHRRAGGYGRSSRDVASSGLSA